MRLTLRTLLAYMDDILDPADHEDLGKKIEASDFATELIHRSRDTVRRLRLGAPPIMGTESDDVLESNPAADANVVAEYLDNTLPPEQVAEFERVCLEPGTTADMHLAEVTSCHHVLTMVLGEPAETDPGMRHRMYDLPNKVASGQKLRIEGSHAPEQQPAATTEKADPTATVVTVASAATAPPRAELPDYLRAASDHRRRIRLIATSVALLIVGAFTAYLVTDAIREPTLQPEVSQAETVAEPFRPDRQDVVEPEQFAEPERDPLEFDPPEADVETIMDSELPTQDPSAGPFPDFFPGAVADPTDRFADARGEPLDIGAEDAPGDTDAPDPRVREPSMPADELVDRDPGVVDDLESARVIPPEVPPLDVPGLPILDPPLESDTDLSDTGEDASQVRDDEEPMVDDAVPPEPPGPVRMGNYVGNNDVLLRYDPLSDRWFRLRPRSVINAGDILLSVPKFRTHVVLGNMNAYLSGGTRIEIPDQQDSDDSGEMTVDLNIVHGRVLLNAGINGSHVRLQLGDDSRELHLGSSASLAVEVRRKFIPGVDPETEVLPIEATWYLTSGDTNWTGDTGETSTVRAPMRWQTVDGVEAPPRTVEELPAWIDREPLTALDRGAAAILAEELPEGESIGIRLLELNEHRRNEVKALATEASLYVGEFEPFVKELENSSLSRQWDNNIDAVRQSLALGPEMKHKLYDAFEAIRGARAAEDLMEMIIGYTPAEIGVTRDDVRQGAMVKLIGWLDHDRLDYRVLAFHNLRTITGTGNLEGYNPAGLPRSRNIAVTKIRNRFENNELMPRP